MEIKGNNTNIKRIAYCAGMDPEDYKAASSVADGASLIDYSNYVKTYEAVVSGDCDVCILPFEKSRTGDVTHVMDLFYSGDLSIIKVFKWDSGNEITRYAVLGKEPNESACEDGSRFMMIFTPDLSAMKNGVTISTLSVTEMIHPKKERKWSQISLLYARHSNSSVVILQNNLMTEQTLNARQTTICREFFLICNCF